MSRESSVDSCNNEQNHDKGGGKSLTVLRLFPNSAKSPPSLTINLTNTSSHLTILVT